MFKNILKSLSSIFTFVVVIKELFKTLYDMGLSLLLPPFKFCIREFILLNNIAKSKSTI